MKKLLKKVWDFVKNLINKTEDKIESLIPVAVNIVEGVKKAVNSNTTIFILDVIKAAIPGEADDKIIDKAMATAKEYIPKLALQLNLLESTHELESDEEKIEAVINVLKTADKDLKSDYLHQLAAYVLKKLSDHKLTLGECASIVEFHYQNKVKNVGTDN